MSNNNEELRQALNLLRQGAQSLERNFAIPPTTSTSTTDTPANSTSARQLQEHRRLFNRQLRVQPYGGRSRAPSSRGRGGAAKERTFTRTMVCLSSKDQTAVPTALEKLSLSRNNLGEKKVVFPCDVSGDVVKDVLFDSFPKLRRCGGFELLLTEEKSRTQLRVMHFGACSTDELKCLGTGRIYIRPVQADIPLKSQQEDEGMKEECLTCGACIPLSKMREHMDSHSPESTEVKTQVQVPDDDDDDDDDDNDEHDLDRPTFDYNSSTQSSSNTSRPVRIETSANATTATASLQNLSSSSQIATNTTPSSSTLSSSSNESTSGAILNGTSAKPTAYKEHLQKAVDETVKEMDGCEDPVAVLRCFQQHFLRGRKLDLEEEDISNFNLLEGDTREIFVSRFALFDDAMAELTLNQVEIDYSIPLNVTYNGECAMDYGGPRRQFLCTVMKEVKDRLFEEHEDESLVLIRDKAALYKQYFFGAGVIFGYSLLQGGPLPSFLHESMITKLFVDIEVSKEEQQFREGLSKFGLLKLFKLKACLKFLFVKTATHPMSYPKLVRLLKPEFSEDGTNARISEEKTYRFFLNYLKEVAAGRRSIVPSLEMVVKFVTGSENEPVLGFAIPPKVEFSHQCQSCFPTSNTCANKLALPCGDVLPKDEKSIFEFYDMAFGSDYFGKA